jgi:general secretion pathway protein B
MSFILDALKKSENERQRQIGPALADIPLRRARSERPWWAVAVACLLVVNLGVLVVVLARDRTPARQTQQQSATEQAAIPQPARQSIQQQLPAPAVAAPSSTSSNPAVRSLAEEAGTDSTDLAGDASMDPGLADAANVPEGPPVVRPITPPTVASWPNQSTFAARGRTNTADEEMLPTHGSLIANGTSLPELRLDIHVFSASPAERFVFVNMRKYVEGQNLNEGPLLERITTQGAVLNQNGTRFLLPRQ